MSFFICNFGAATCPTEDIAAVLNYAAIIKMWWSGKGGGGRNGLLRPLWLTSISSDENCWLTTP